MTEVTEANPADGDDLSLDVEADENQDLELDAGAEGDGDEGEEADDLDDVELDGKAYKVPKDIKAAVMRHQDYTKKTMEVAESRRELEAQRATLVQEDQAIFTAKAKLLSLNDRVTEYQGVDWANLAESDRINGTAEYATHWTIYQKLQAEQADLGQRLNYTLGQRQAEAQRINAQRLQENRQTLAKEIPGFSNELLGKLQTYAQTEFGIPTHEVGEDLNPAAMKVLHRLYTLEQAAKKTKQADRHVAAQAVTPAARVTPKGNAITRLDDRQSPEAWMAQREAQLRKNGGR